jgi:ABC-type Co2+ transport system permease subunit
VGIPAATVVGLTVAAGLLAFLERRLERNPDFPLGLLLGAVTGYATVWLNCLVLWAGGVPEVQATAGVILLAHLPVVAVESVGVGFVVAYLGRAMPEWLGERSCVVRSLRERG